VHRPTRRRFGGVPRVYDADLGNFPLTFPAHAQHDDTIPFELNAPLLHRQGLLDPGTGGHARLDLHQP